MLFRSVSQSRYTPTKHKIQNTTTRTYIKVRRGAISLVDNVNHVRRQHKRDPVPLEDPKHLRIAQEAAKVNVEEMAVTRHHDVVVVAITDACPQSTKNKMT